MRAKLAAPRESEEASISAELLRELVAAHETAAETFCQNAALWREIRSARETADRLRGEFRLLRAGDETAVWRLVETLLAQNRFENCNTLLLQKMRVLLAANERTCDVSEDFLVSTVSTMGELHVRKRRENETQSALARAHAITAGQVSSQPSSSLSSVTRRFGEKRAGVSSRRIVGTKSFALRRIIGGFDGCAGTTPRTIGC